jgi:hypothetical protein
MYDKQIKEMKVQTSNGYLYFTDYDHPLAVGNSGKVYYHRHVASMARGRWLTDGEVVHHIDGDRKNNSEDNLIVTTNSRHVATHWRERGCERKTVSCSRCGKKFQERSGANRFCSPECCHLASRRVLRPEREILLREVKSLGFVGVGRKYGVSDNAIRKWLGLR